MKKLVRLIKEYNIYQFDKHAISYNDKYTTFDENGFETQYSGKIYNEWIALCLLMFFNILNYNLMPSTSKIPLIKSIRNITNPFSPGLREIKEFIDQLIENNIIKDVNAGLDYSHAMHFMLTNRGKVILERLNSSMPKEYIDKMIAQFAKCTLLNDKTIIWENSIIGIISKNYFNFNNFYNEEKERIELGV